MKAVILAGGKGTRIVDNVGYIPKPLVEAAGQTLLWHIMMNFSRFGIDDFIILAGYRGHVIKEYFQTLWMRQADVTFDLMDSRPKVNSMGSLPWKVRVIDSGSETMTGGRLAYLTEIINEPFLLTYGDGVADVNIDNLISAHSKGGRVCTLTAVRPPARFGALQIENDEVINFIEKPLGDGSWINGGFFVMNPDIFGRITGDQCILESEILPNLAAAHELSVYRHEGIFAPVDTIRDLQVLETIIHDSKLPWI